MSDWIGRIVSKVEIQKLLGRGGMAEVYLGRHTTLDRLVAVKVLQSHLSEDANLLSRFKSEAQAVAAMRHPNIVQVFDFDVVEDRPYIVMELLDGLSLREYLTSLHTNELRLQPRTISHLITGLASALDYAHSRGIVHRDIKPANIMLRRETGEVSPAAPLPLDTIPVLTDFGVARIANATAHTASGTIIGTPAYMSPEQVRGAVIDSRSDIYSLGIVLYEMLVGRVPFSSETQASILLAQINEPPPPLPGDYSELQPLLDRALAKDPTQRFQKASDMAAVLAASMGLPGDTSSTEPRVARESLMPIDSGDAFTVRLEAPTSASPVPSGNTTTIQPQPTGFNPLWIAGGLGGAALIGVIVLAIVLLSGRGLQGGPGATTTPGGAAGITETAEVPAESPTPAAPAAPVGAALFRDATISGTFEDLDELPDGSFYQAWLIGPEAQPQSLGKLEVFNGRTSVDFTSPDGSPLLPRFTGFEISVEQGAEDALKPSNVVYRGDLADDVLKGIEAVQTVAPNQSIKSAILDGVKSQGAVYNSHLSFTIEAINGGNLPSTQQHGEHVINIVVGNQDERFGDFNGDGKPANPGNGVGLEVYLKLLQQSITSTADSPDASQEVHAAANELIDNIDDALATLEAAVQTEQGITVADSAEETKNSLDQLNNCLLSDQLASLADKAGALDLGLSVEVLPVSSP